MTTKKPERLTAADFARTAPPGAPQNLVQSAFEIEALDRTLEEIRAGREPDPDDVKLLSGRAQQALPSAIAIAEANKRSPKELGRMLSLAKTAEELAEFLGTILLDVRRRCYVIGLPYARVLELAWTQYEGAARSEASAINFCADGMELAMSVEDFAGIVAAGLLAARERSRFLHVSFVHVIERASVRQKSLLN